MGEMVYIWTFGLPVPVGLALIALLGYFIAQRQRRESPDSEQVRHDLKRARGVIHSLERISRDVRRHLAAHNGSIGRFKDRVRQLSRAPSQRPGWQELSEEAERMLQPTLRLANQVAHAYDEIRQQANLLMTFTEVRTDPLTGLCNRRALDETLTRMFALMTRYHNIFSIGMFDIDHFKTINDEQGHLYGDYVLQQMARVLNYCARETDTVARFGGEEFLVIMPETDLEGAAIFAERLRVAVAEQLNLTVSGGIATALDGDSPQTLVARADAALYQAKQSGRDLTFRHTGLAVEPVPELPLGEAEATAPQPERDSVPLPLTFPVSEIPPSFETR